MAYEHRLRVRYGETDQMGVVHHANYLLYMEEARTEYMASLGCSYAALEKRGTGLAVRRAELRFRSPARYEDLILVETRLGRVGAASAQFLYELRHEGDGRHIASGTVELACIDLESDARGPQPLPDDVRAVFEAAREA
jgi:acyl-CoA thioester hydrolase